MTSTAAVVTAIGMTTPVGLTAAQSCAALRAGISAIAELDFVREDDAFEKAPVMGCAIRGVTDGYLGLGRWTRLAVSALRDLVAASRLQRTELASAALYLALPPVTRGGVDPRIGQLLASRIAEWMGLPGLEARVRVYPEGHAAAARACAEARAHVAQGAVHRAVVCAVDSLVEPPALEFFLGKRRLKTDDRIDGFVPGEAAAALLIERASDAASRGVTPLAVLEVAATAIEPITVWSDDPSSAHGLSEAIGATLDQLADRGRQTQLIVCDLNGETYRAKEFGTAAARSLSAIQARWALWHPADAVGDTGAAAFVVSAGAAAKGLAKGYAPGDTALVLGSSDDGLRGALALRRVPTEAER